MVETQTAKNRAFATATRTGHHDIVLALDFRQAEEPIRIEGAEQDCRFADLLTAQEVERRQETDRSQGCPLFKIRIKRLESAKQFKRLLCQRIKRQVGFDQVASEEVVSKYVKNKLIFETASLVAYRTQKLCERIR